MRVSGGVFSLQCLQLVLFGFFSLFGRCLLFRLHGLGHHLGLGIWDGGAGCGASLVHVSFVTFANACMMEDNLESDSGSFVSYLRTTQSASSSSSSFFLIGGIMLNTLCDTHLLCSTTIGALGKGLCRRLSSSILYIHPYLRFLRGMAGFRMSKHKMCGWQY